MHSLFASGPIEQTMQVGFTAGQPPRDFGRFINHGGWLWGGNQQRTPTFITTMRQNAYDAEPQWVKDMRSNNPNLPHWLTRNG